MSFFKLAALSLFAVISSASALEIHGHRGARSLYPENTLPSLEEALRAGVEVLEFDLGLTKDGVLVLHHDRYVNPKLCQWMKPGSQKTVKKNTFIRSLSLKEIKQLDCGTLANERFPQQKRISKLQIPTLKEVFDFVKNSKLPAAKTVKFNIETKINPRYPSSTATPKEFAQALYKVLKEEGVLERTVVQSFDFRSLKEIRKIDPKVKISALTEEKEDFVKIAKKLKANVISPNWETISKEDVKALRALNVLVVPWTANTPESWEKLLSLKVDGIITDNPAALVTFLKEKHPEVKRFSGW